MKPLMLNIHSKNNEQLFQLTLQNHAEYCGKYEYSMLNLNLPYNINLDIPLILGLLNTFGAVIALGSDIWFTNMDIDVMSLVKPDAAMTMGQDPCADIPANGDFVIFQNTPKIKSLLEKIGKIQDSEKSRFGFQDAIKSLLHSGDADGLDILPARVLQSFPQHKDILKPVREDCFWKPGDLCIHFVGGDNWKKALDVLAFSKLNIIFNI
jgi:hypothetical protein